MEEPQVTGTSFLSMQVCIPKEWTDEQVVEFAEKENRCGTENGWVIRKQGHELLAGSDERVQCSQREGYVHVMLDC